LPESRVVGPQQRSQEFVFGCAPLRPEWLKFEAEGRERGGVLGKGAASPLPPARGSG